MPLRGLREADVEGVRALVRVDFNVPFADGCVSDDTRLRASLPTISHLRERGARVVLCSHLGRPKGAVDETLRLGAVARRLSELLGCPVGYVRECIGPEAATAVQALVPGDVLLLENLRFHAGEEKNDSAFAGELASLADLFVNDAFGAAHRAHASTVGVTNLLPSYAGFLLEKEAEMLGAVLHDPQRPFAVVVGGAKISDKLPVLQSLLDKVDRILIGGGMVAAFFRAQGRGGGASAEGEEQTDAARRLLADAQARGVDVLLPHDVVVAGELAADAPHRTVSARDVPPGWLVLDIGPASVEQYRETLQSCRTVLWNGPMGVFEFPAFSHGTRALAETIAALPATTVIGGGSTGEAVASLGLADDMTHVSTGGGASLEFLEGKQLPGLAALTW